MGWDILNWMAIINFVNFNSATVKMYNSIKKITNEKN